MIESDRLKQVVKQDYMKIAEQSCGCCSSGDFVIYDEALYSAQDGYQQTADMALSCGCPVPFTGIQTGQTVVDLGCGGGLDVFIAEKKTGPAGKVIGVDFTPAMIEKANQNRMKLGLNNVEFILSDIEYLALESNIADVIISNCVLNLVPDKLKAFQEIRRVLKPGGYFCISDMATDRPWPEPIKNDPAGYSACLTGALTEKELLSVILQAGFATPEIIERKTFTVPEPFIQSHQTKISKPEWPSIFSLTIKAIRPS